MERDGNVRQNLCPIGSLGVGEEYVRVKFVHSYQFEEAKKLWDRRLERVNLKNIFVKIALDAEDKNSLDYIREFTKVNANKVCFYSGNNSDKVLYLKRFEKYVKTGRRTATIKFNDYIRDMEWLTKSVDILKLLNGEEEYLRE